MHMTKLSRKITGCWITLAGFFALTLLLAGCGGLAHPGSNLGAPTGATNLNTFCVGDTVMVICAGPGAEGAGTLQPHEEKIKDDGTITLQLVGTIVAAGKAPGNLQKELQEKYNNFYKNITVTVKDLARYYSVGGEVRSPGPKEYLGETDIIKAIQASGDFTDFAKKTKVHLIRNGRTQIINCVKAVDHPEYDVLIYPMDKIVVPRRLW
jgi:protein involved in polysaccharide export with SLBB domain